MSGDITLPVDVVKAWRALYVSSPGEGPEGDLCRAVDAALPAPIVWETHLGVEMARVGDRVAMHLDDSAAPYRCHDAGWTNYGWKRRADAEAWLRGGDA